MKPTGTRQARWILAVLGVLGIVVAGVVVWNGKSRDMGISAEMARNELVAAQDAGATATGLTLKRDSRGTTPLTCSDAPGKGSFFLDRLTGPPVEDVDAMLAKVRASWEERGLGITPRQIGDAKGMSATDQYGGSVYILSGGGGTVIAGESACLPLAAGTKRRTTSSPT